MSNNRLARTMLVGRNVMLCMAEEVDEENGPDSNLEIEKLDIGHK